MRTCALANESMSNALTAGAVRNATDAPKIDPSACLLPKADESSFFPGATQYALAVQAETAKTRQAEAFMVIVAELLYSYITTVAACLSKV